DCISFFIIRHNCHLFNQITLHFVSNNTIFQKIFLYYILNFKVVKLIKDILSLLLYFMIFFLMIYADYIYLSSFFIYYFFIYIIIIFIQYDIVYNLEKYLFIMYLIIVPLLLTLLNMVRDNPHAPSLLLDLHTNDF